ncbi:ABC transporter permease [Nostoc sp. ChiQUE01b]|uniref:ABC transporter permease n=1 Tax=Nostoc sp. ChiQUE01b TaxID=3075376 RepID=UPI002AD54E6D|nr:ABC transporter permease [Nostoc sp. ChiQUE01b]MDZ8262765.1 ABC transporter permease [Nostoc sp. ChiQUE01b]
MKRIFAQTIKELTQLGRDRLSLLMALGLPLILLLLFGFGVSLKVNQINFAIQDLDETFVSREYVATFERTTKFNIVAYGPNVNVPQLLDRGKVAAGLIIPSKFARDFLRTKRGASAQILIDGTDSNTANIVRGYAKGITNTFVENSQGRNVPVVSLQSQSWYNPGLETLKYIGPGALAITVTLFPTLLAALTTAKEYEQGTILQVYASSLTGMEYLLGKATAFWLVGMAEVLLVNIEAWLVFGLWFAGDPTPMIVGSSVYITCGVFWGIFIGRNTQIQSAAIQAVSFTAFLSSLQLSGYIYPVSNIPIAIRWISYLIPAQHYILITRDAYARGVGWLGVWLPVLALALLASLFFFLAWRRLRSMQVG